MSIGDIVWGVLLGCFLLFAVWLAAERVARSRRQAKGRMQGRVIELRRKAS
jgi:hypothetical protein